MVSIRKSVFGVSCLVFCVLLIVSLVGCRRVPQVLTDEAVFGELDALYTAVTTRRRDLLNDCQKRLMKLHDEHKVSEAGYDEIEAIIKTAEADNWTKAAERLYTFMRGQRKQKSD